MTRPLTPPQLMEPEVGTDARARSSKAMFFVKTITLHYHNLRDVSWSFCRKYLTPNAATVRRCWLLPNP